MTRRMPLAAWRQGIEWTPDLPSCVCTDCQEEDGGCDDCPACQLLAEDPE